MKPSPLLLLPFIGFAAGWLAGSSTDTSIVRPPIELAATARNLTKIEASGDRSQVVEHATETRTLPSIRLETPRDALGHPSALHRLGAFAPLLKNLNAAQFATLRAELAALNPPPDSGILALFYRRWAQVAPEAAVDAAIQEHFKGNEWCWHPALMAWGESDPDAALARFEKMTFVGGFSANSTRDWLRHLAMPKPGQLPPAQAVRRIRELQGDGEATPSVMNSMSAILREWVKTDPQAAWAEALALPNEGKGSETREWALGSVVRAQAASDPKAVEQWIDALPDGAQRGMLQADYVSALAWAGKSNQARTYAMAMPEGSARQKAVGGLAAALFRQDADAAKAFVESLPAADWKDPTVFGDFFEGWLRTEPERATEVLLKRVPADAHPSPDQQAAYYGMFFSWTGRNPRAGSDFLLKLPEEVRSKSLTDSVAAFCHNDAAGAGAWAAALPAGSDRDKILGQVAANWARQGVSQVTQWLDTLPLDSGKSAAVESFARTIISTSADDALAWLRAVADEADRLARLGRVWNSWSDRDAAQQWLENSPQLTSSEREALKKLSPSK